MSIIENKHFFNSQSEYFRDIICQLEGRKATIVR
jgi:hypothetical protein